MSNLVVWDVASQSSKEVDEKVLKSGENVQVYSNSFSEGSKVEITSKGKVGSGTIRITCEANAEVVITAVKPEEKKSPAKTKSK